MRGRNSDNRLIRKAALSADSALACTFDEAVFGRRVGSCGPTPLDSAPLEAGVDKDQFQVFAALTAADSSYYLDTPLRVRLDLVAAIPAPHDERQVRRGDAPQGHRRGRTRSGHTTCGLPYPLISRCDGTYLRCRNSLGWEHAMGLNRQDKAGGKQAFD